MTTPLLAVIRHNYPTAAIAYVASTWSKVVPEHHPAVDMVIDCGTVGLHARYSLADYVKLVMVLRKQHFDLAFVLDRSPLLTLLPWLAGVPRRVGLDSQGRGFSLTDRVPVSSSPAHLEHQADSYLRLARALDLAVEQPHMRFEPTEQERRVATPAYGSFCPRVAVFPGGGSNPGMELTAKRWPLERYKAVINKLIQQMHAQVVLLGGPDDVSLVQSLLDGLEMPEEALLNLAGKTSFGQMAAQLAQCALFIGNDSGPMHLAVAVNIPVIAIFGPTSPREYGPYPLNDPQHIALWHHPTGQPCFFLGKMRSCTHCTCMQTVTVDEVWHAAQRLIAQRDEVTQ
ncbi:MAG: lipopolysaccharide heptosyltransferase II [Ktedonobacteraceae bacterium]|nr:lipopolysaccharide heptosyltransferase II [Ktedonobacteraceae bacterium]